VVITALFNPRDRLEDYLVQYEVVYILLLPCEFIRYYMCVVDTEPLSNLIITLDIMFGLYCPYDKRILTRLFACPGYCVTETKEDAKLLGSLASFKITQEAVT
jgi:hypothetical protein